LRRDREAIGRILARGPDSALAVDALATIGSVQKSTELSQALHDLTTKQAELRALRTRYADANPAVRRVAVEVQDLERRTIPDLRLVDPAVQPEEPTENWRPVLIALAFLASLGAGVAGAAVLDHTDRSVRYPQQVTGAMGLPILGAVPHLNRNGGRRKPDGV